MNPWLTRAVPETEVPAAESAEPTPPPATGPTAPQCVPVPDAVDRLPRRRWTVSATVWWVGVHGGSGESSLAALLPSSRSSGHAWPVPPSWPTLGVPARVILVARSNARGLQAAQHAAAEWASGGVPEVDLLGLVMVADAPGKLPRGLRDLAGLVAGGVPRTWRIPWIEAWRSGETFAADAAPKEVLRLLADVRALVPFSPAASRVTD